MAEYDLPGGPRELFEATLPTLARYLGEDNIRLGGGTALAMRWHHRHSTDVDLFVDPAVYAPLYRAPDDFLEQIECGPLEVDLLGVYPSWCQLRFVEGEVSMMTHPSLTHDPRSADTVRGTRVALETSAEILAKKLGPRMIGSEVYVPRDVYDLACARTYDPEALHTAFRSIHPNYRRDIRDKLNLLPARWMENHPKQVRSPARPEDMPLAVAIVRRLLRKSLEPPVRGRKPGMDR